MGSMSGTSLVHMPTSLRSVEYMTAADYGMSLKINMLGR